MVGLRVRHRQARVEQVLNAASMLFSQRGYEATRIEEIAESAEVAPATIYNYFATKPNILTALAVRHARASLPQRRALIRNLPDDPIAAVYAFETLLADQALRTLNRDCWRVILSAPLREPGGEAHKTSKRFGALIRRHYRMMLRSFQQRGRIKQTVDIEALAGLITAIGTHHFTHLVSDDAATIDGLKAAVNEHINMVFVGVLSKPRGITAKARKE